MILPIAVTWAERTEQRILRSGIPLPNPSLDDARRMGVEHPERIRLLLVQSIPFPNNPTLRIASRVAGFDLSTIAGMALRYGILIRADSWGDRMLIAHECVHTAQYERMGGIKPFLRRYLRECIEIGYPSSPMEQEALTKSAELGFR
jgi:hypothetical protein